MAGFCVNMVRVEENQSAGIREAWIQDLGVRRNWRRQGIGEALVSASMRAFKADGFDYAGLAVDGDNLTGAHRIYERLGFQLTFSKVYLAKSVLLLDANAA